MNAVTLETHNDRFLISIGRDYVDQEFLIGLVERIKLEHLVKAANFDERIEELGEQIKADWWQQNKDRLLNRKA